MMTKPITDKPRWPFGFRILLWLAGPDRVGGRVPSYLALACASDRTASRAMTAYGARSTGEPMTCRQGKAS